MVVTATCSCGSIGAPDEVRRCPDHHRYWRGDRELTSVTKIVKTIWPIQPDFAKALPGVIENARDRGIVVDELFSAYISGTLDHIPAGTRQDAVELFFKVRRWWDEHKHDSPKAQVILADHEIAGTCDVHDGDQIYDLKCTYDLEATYPLQLAAYAELHFATFGRPAKSLTIIHATKRYPAPKIIKLDLSEVLQDWMTLRQMWTMVTRRTK